MTNQMIVTIAGRNYPIRIQNEDEKKTIEEAVELINLKMNEYRATYDGKDAQDYLAMVSMSLVVEWLSSKYKNESEVHLLAESIDTIVQNISS